MYIDLMFLCLFLGQVLSASDGHPHPLWLRLDDTLEPHSYHQQEVLKAKHDSHHVPGGDGYKHRLYTCSVDANLPLPIAMTWSPPPERSREKSDGVHCISCSEEKPRMAQLVRIATNTITRITSNHTPISRALQDTNKTSIILYHRFPSRNHG